MAPQRSSAAARPVPAKGALLLPLLLLGAVLGPLLLFNAAAGQRAHDSVAASADHRRSAPAAGTLLEALQTRASNALHALDVMTPPRAPFAGSGHHGAASAWGHALGAAVGGAGAALHSLGARAGGGAAPPGGATAGGFDNTPLPPLQPLQPLSFRQPDPFDDRPASCTPKAAMPELGGARQLQWTAPPGPNGPPEAWPVNCGGHEALCEVLRKVAVNREVMVAVANSQAPGLQGFLDSIKALNIPNFMVVAIDAPLAKQLTASGVPHYFKENAAQGNHKVSAQKFSLLKEFVGVGCSVLLTDTDVVYLQNPFGALYRDADIESMSDGWDARTLHGWLDAVQDPSLGARSPGRRGATLRAAALNSGLWYVTATKPVLGLMTVMEHRMATEDLWDQSGYNMELFLPAHDAHLTAGASVRVMSPLCFVNSKVLFRYIRFQEYLKDFRPVAIHVNYHADKSHKMTLAAAYYLQGDAGGLNRCVGDGCAQGMVPVDVLEAGARAGVNDGFVSGRNWGVSRQDALQHGCAPQPAWGGKLGPGIVHELARLPTRRASATGPLLCAAGSEALCGAMQTALQAAPPAGFRPADVMLTVASEADAPALRVLLRSMHALRLAPRAVVITLDDAAAAAVKAEAAPVAHAALPSDGPLRQDAKGAPLSAPAVKWAVIAAALRMGVDLLIIDADTVLLQNPMGFLYRDCDVEAQADGWDETSAWGYDHVVDDPTMGWSRYCHGTRMSTRDPGLVLLQATAPAAAVAARVARRLAAAGPPAPPGLNVSAERAIFNEETWLPSHGEYVSVGVSLRVMNFFCFANSKSLLRFMRKDDGFRRFKPVSARLSYHADKAALGEGVLAEYGAAGTKGAVEAALKASMGAKADLPKTCTAAGLRPATAAEEGDASSPAAALLGFVGKHREWSWAGMTPFRFAAAGVLETPWGGGKWGVGAEPGALFVEFAGAKMALQFEPDGGQPFGMFVSTRCGDGDIVLGRVADPPPAAPPKQ